MKRILFSAILLGSMVSTAGAATGVLNQKNLSLDLADKVAQNTLQACAKDGYNVAVTLVDRSGTPLLMKRMDNAGPHTVEASRMKAFTALTTKNLTGNVMKGAQSNAGAANLRYIPDFLLLAGGVPVKVGDQVIGAVGVGGAPGGNFDEACALAGVKSIESELNAG
ncbi:heme-binding protein [Salmonella enterica]|uniref:Heme-binding protein n=1 Tax=Salmonella enterica TaxID=28901 RepID=A0A3I6S1N0_SALER|nr:heme-binding protein [Salmonella enterica]EBX0087350.1 heme-binding protein [Salmonella enterica subsp. enterica serovar Miami]EBY3697926.1 heme-binding protein [Salmonella enterica subsp. enterica serovar Muenchen]ECC8720529.1 heme-binding protein [Salmonella enterica subsp. houtenae]ECE0917548.1 heme-binding protein [Salmonella enterica subsp. enterica]ECT9565166.1 heme-binding protein [Salmonella enterica subsp. enterica serovar Newport]EDQ6995154.1 heme-binding protein [Salmonella ente